MERGLIRMNERLKQIATEAKVEHCISHVRLKEFADLIVRECMAKALQGQLTNMNGNQIAYIIKEHFGVEEPETPKLGPGVNYRPTYPDQE